MKKYRAISPSCIQFSLLRFPLLLTLIMAAVTAYAEVRDIYLVLVEGDPPVAFRQGVLAHADYSQREHAARLMESHDQLLQRTLTTYTKLYSFHHILNGFAIHTTPSQAKKLAAVHGVVRVEKDRHAKLMTTYTPHILGLPERVWGQAAGGEEHAGEGMVIGVVDTGIDPTHPSFAYEPPYPLDPYDGECDVGPWFAPGSCNGKIVSARYFAAGAAAAAIPMDASDLSPFDKIGHGSHVASIAAGNWGVPVVVDGFKYGTASGMAPRARVAAYKAIYPGGGTLADVVAAIDRAAEDRVDVLVLSIGPDEPPKDTITFMNVFDISLLFARRAGVLVVQAAGNKGPEEATVVSFSPWAVGVAASTTPRTYTATVVIGDGRQLQGIGLSAPTLGNGVLQYRLVWAKDAACTVNGSLIGAASSLSAEECQHPEALQEWAVQDSIVVCSFSQGFLNGTSTVTAILHTATLLGFSGFILVANPLYGDFIAEPLPFPVPAAMIPRTADVQILWEYYEKHTYREPGGVAVRYVATAAIRDGRVAAFDRRPAPVVARFSSRGPDIVDSRMNPADVLKPDVLAPGHQIWAAWSPASTLDPILSGDSFALVSGTSMAAPHVAGVAALIKQSHPSWTPSMIASAMSTTAAKHDDRGLPIMAEGPQLYTVKPSTPFDHGAGFIHPSAALDPGLVFPSGFEDYVGFLCSLPGLDPASVKASTGRACNGSFSWLPSSSPADLNLPSVTVSALMGFQSVHRTARSVASEPETYTCAVLPPEGVAVDVEPRWFTIEPDGAQGLEIKLNVTRKSDSFTFGEILLTGSLDHIVRLPLSIFPVSLDRGN